MHARARRCRSRATRRACYRQQPSYAVKAPVFSFAKLTEVDISLGPEMKSTGEIMGIDIDFSRALYKAMVASGWTCLAAAR